MRRRSTAFAAALAVFASLSVHAASAQEAPLDPTAPPVVAPPPLPPPLPPPAFPTSESQCTTTYTVTTKCTGDAAGLAVPQPAPPPVYAPPVYAPPPSPPPYVLMPRAHVEERRRYGLMAGGISLFAGVYVWNVVAAAGIEDARLAIPVFGPLFFLDDGRDAGGLNALLVLDTLAQASGVAMLIAGAATHKKVTVYDRGDTHITIAPGATYGGAGLAAVGTF